MDRKRIGERPPRYSFILNPYVDERLSKCPLCQRPTHPRKFALFMHVDGWGPLALGKTCRYCSRCELIIAHKNEVDAEVSQAMDRLRPACVGNPYLVLGTVEQSIWKKGLQGGQQLGDILVHVAEFEKHLTLEVDPGGWQPRSD